MHWLGVIMLLIAAAYGLGFRDGYKGRPPEPLRGTYDSGEHEDRVDEYGDWH